jgi:hypothetical protein
MRRRGCMSTLVIFVLLALLCCGSIWLIGLPRARDTVSDRISNGLSTQIADQLGGVTLQPGEHTLSVSGLQQQMQDAGIFGNDVELRVSVSPAGLFFSFDTNGQTIGYTGTPAVEDGKLVIEYLESDNDVLGFLLPPDKLAGALERGVNTYVSAQGQQMQDLTLGADVITFVTVST